MYDMFKAIEPKSFTAVQVKVVLKDRLKPCSLESVVEAAAS
jgi:hypothetical protein